MTIRRLRIGVSSLAVVALVAVVWSPVAAATSAPSGDPATIAFYRQVASAYRNVPSITATRHGYLSYTVTGTAFRFAKGEAPPTGFRPASESLLYFIRNGRIFRYIDRAHAPGLPALTIIEDATGVWAAVNSHPGACYYHNPRSSGVAGWGYPFVGVFGDFVPLQKSGNLVTVHSTYPWGKSGAKASETDRFDAKSHNFLSFRAQITGTTPFTWGMSTFHQGKPPTLTPVPAPHC